MPYLARTKNPLGEALRNVMVGEEPESTRGKVGSILADVLGFYPEFQPAEAMLTPAYLNAAQRAALEGMGVSKQFIEYAQKTPRKLGQVIKSIEPFEHYLKDQPKEMAERAHRAWRAAITRERPGFGEPIIPFKESEYSMGVNVPKTYGPRGASSYLHEAGHVLEDFIGKMSDEDHLRLWRAANRMPKEDVEWMEMMTGVAMPSAGEIIAEAFRAYKTGDKIFKEFPETIKHMIKKYAKRAR